MKIDLKTCDTPCYVVDENLLTRNLEILKEVIRLTDCEIILALKGFAMFSLFPLIKKYLSGTAASSLDEARLGFEEFGKEVHVYAPAYRDDEFNWLMKYASHISFNSFAQWEKFKPVIQSSNKKIKCGLRINPEHSEVKVALYDPCAPLSRLGIKIDQFEGKNLDGISGLHFHTLCELNSDALERTLQAVERKFGCFISKMEYINFGGGHHITRSDYDITRLCKVINDFKKRYNNIKVYLEPGEAIALNAGFLVSTVLDIIQGKDMDIAILDTSAAAHMPDVLEMPYRPVIEGSGKIGEYPYSYRLGGLTCLAGDVIGDYSFKASLKQGTRLTFMDMAHYTMVKNNTFNGIRLPSIVLHNSKTGKTKLIREFGYKDYRDRLS
ncbi:MAG: carboxynorspermidine decarboxylase [Candidatus Omnitrophota bacterium]|nr:carboxynorspermidine decarboxylase [Candidatus Omnitrophota bacterium]